MKKTICSLLTIGLIGFASGNGSALNPAAPRLDGTGVPGPAGREGGKLEAKVGPYKGRNVIFVNGKPIVPLMYAGTEQCRRTWEGKPRKSIEQFSALGYEIIQTDMWFKYSLKPDETFELEGIRKQLSGILSVNPKAKIIVRINVSAPQWWLNQNASEICRTTCNGSRKDEFAGNTAESLASVKYAEFANRSLRRFLRDLENTPEGDSVIGFHIGGGVYGEWHYYGIYNEPDASEPMRRKFVAFAKDRYGSIERINAAWKTGFGNFDAITVPSYDCRSRTTDGDFRNPQEERYVIDYYECQQATVSALVNGLAKTTKESWGRPTLVGLFFGYFYGAWTVGAQASQFDIKTLFKSPYVDYFSGPYASRNQFGSGCFRSLAESVSLNGKLWISEHDGGTFLGRVGGAHFPDTPRTEAESIARMRRNFMYTLTERAGQWWYDFGPELQSGTWGTPAMLSEAGELLKLSKAFLEQPYEKKADVLVVYDMDAFNYVRPARVDRLTSRITEEMSDALLGTGAAFDRVFLTDLPLVDLSRYKLVIFGNTFVLNQAQRNEVATRVIAVGRTVVFLSGAGYSDGNRNDVSLISGLVGMRIAKGDGLKPVVKVTLAGETHKLDASGVTSLFKVIDENALPIGVYASGEAGAAVRNIKGCKVYYFGLPLKAGLPFLKALLRDAGASSYVEGTVERDYVAVGGGIIGIYSVDGGTKTIKPLGGRNKEVVMHPFSTQYFDLNTGEALTHD